MNTSRRKRDITFSQTKVKVRYFGKLCIPTDLLDNFKTVGTDTFYLDVNENNLVVGGGRTIGVFQNPSSFGKYPNSLVEGRPGKTRYLTFQTLVDKMGVRLGGSGLRLRATNGRCNMFY